MESHPTTIEIFTALERYNFITEILAKIIIQIEKNNSKNNHWYTFSEKIARKYLYQSYSLEQIFKNQEKRKYLDISSISSLLRIQIETYLIFFHLFIDKCEMEEKILRFKLWELEGLKNIKKIKPKIIKQKNLKNEEIDIKKCISEIEEIPYFKNLNVKIQKYLIKFSFWRYDQESFKNIDTNKEIHIRISIEKMLIKLNLKEEIFNNLYSFTSTHIHSSYWSIIQNLTLTEEDSITHKYTSIMHASFISCFLIKDLCKIYDCAKVFFNKFSENEKNIINSFEISGRYS